MIRSGWMIDSFKYYNSILSFVSINEVISLLFLLIKIYYLKSQAGYLVSAELNFFFHKFLIYIWFIYFIF